LISNEEITIEKNKYFKTEDSYIISDAIIIFIGVGMFITAVLSYLGKVPEEYTFGATLASFLLVFSEWLLLSEKIPGWKMMVSSLCFIMGILSFIVAPLILIGYPKIFNLIAPNSDMLTFSGLGLVLILMGIKSVDHKIKSRVTNLEKENHLESEIEKLKEKINSIK